MDATGKSGKTLRSSMRSSASSLPRKKPEAKPGLGPGPGAYTLPSGIGVQVDSKRKTPSSPSFGSGPARQSLKHAGDTPGPGAYRELAFGRAGAVESKKPRSPEFTMRGREMFGAIDSGVVKAATPGPGAYGRPKKPSEFQEPAYSLGKRTWRTKRRSSTPGPGRYKGPSSMGTQNLSHIRSYNALSFSKSTRPDLAGRPATSIGPGEYGTSSAVGKQPVSIRRNEPAFSFGRGSRFPLPTDSRQLRAGPGSYSLPGSVGSQPLSRYKSAPAASLGSRHAFGSPYG